jgi:hypothetical protein
MKKLLLVLKVIEFDVLAEVDADVPFDGDGHDVTVGQGHLDRRLAADQGSRRIREDDALAGKVVSLFSLDLHKS